MTHEHQAATIMVTHDLHTLDAVDSLHEMVDGRLRTLEAAPTQG